MNVNSFYRGENKEKHEAESGDPALLECPELDLFPHATLAEVTQRGLFRG